eukprot:Skav202657  [mRNA]  locus=scaffold1791:57070:68236:+ [translate_table: standard]
MAIPPDNGVGWCASQADVGKPLIQLLDLDIGWGHRLFGFDDQSDLIAGRGIWHRGTTDTGQGQVHVSSDQQHTPGRRMSEPGDGQNLELLLYLALVLVKLPILCKMQALYSTLEEYVLLECLDDQDQPQGLAVAQVLRRFRADHDGGFLELRYIQASDEYYRHWVKDQVPDGALHHICRHPVKTCRKKIGKDAIHIQRWTSLSASEADKVLKEWKLRPLSIERKRRVLEEDKPVATAAKTMARKKDELSYGLGERDFDSSMSPSPVRAGEARSQHERDGVSKFLGGDAEEGLEKYAARQKRSSALVKRGKDLSGELPGRGRDKGAPGGDKVRSPLDEVLLAGETAGKGLDANEARVEELRARLGEVKKKDQQTSGGAAAVLAARIHKGMEESQENKKRKRSNEKDMVKAIQVLAKTRRRRSSRSTSESTDELDDADPGSGSSKGLMSRQRKLRRIAENKPGALLVRGFQVLHEQLGTLYGGSSSSSKGADAVLQPGALRYLLTAAIPQLDLRQVGEHRLRELRTVATALDLMVGGILCKESCLTRCQEPAVAGQDDPGLGTRRGQGDTVNVAQLSTPPPFKSPVDTSAEEQGWVQGGDRFEEPQPEEEEPRTTEGDIQGTSGKVQRRGRELRGHASDERGPGSCATKRWGITDGMEGKSVPIQTQARGERKEVRLSPVLAGCSAASGPNHAHAICPTTTVGAFCVTSGLGPKPPWVTTALRADCFCSSLGSGPSSTSHPVKAGHSTTNQERILDTSLPVKAGNSTTSTASVKPTLGDPGLACEKVSLDPGQQRQDSTRETLSSRCDTPLEMAGNPCSSSIRGDHPKPGEPGDVAQLLELLRTNHQDVGIRSLVKEVINLVPTVLQLGISVLQLLLMCPRDGSYIETMLKEIVFTPPTRGRDLLPLGRPPVGAALKLLRSLPVTKTGLLVASQCRRNSAGAKQRQKNKRLIFEGCKQIWRLLVVSVLNGQYDSWSLSSLMKLPKMSSPQLASLKHLDEWIARFCVSPIAQVKLPDFEALVKSKDIDYSGEEVTHALPLRLEELLPGLPAPGVAGTLDAWEMSSNQVRAWLEDPRKTLKPSDAWPQKIPSARINCSRDERYRVCEQLLKLGILAPIELSEVFSVDGKPVLNGVFSVLKKGAAMPGEARATRLIMNMVPANSYQRLMTGDLPTLSSSSAWCNIPLRHDQVLLWSGDDQKGAFYAWKLPRVWRAFMTFKWPVPGTMVGSAAVIPMGWINAVSLFQHLHRQVGMSKPPQGAGHAAALEWRRDMPMPFDSGGQVKSFVQFYLDDFDTPEMIPRETWEAMRNTMSPEHLAQRRAYRQCGVGISEDKAHVREPVVQRMGAEIDGIQGTVAAPLEKRLEVAFFALWFLSRPMPHSKVVAELLRAIALLPLAGTDMRAKVNGCVTSSDASESGGGLCCSGALTAEGEHVLQQLHSEEVRRSRLLPFQPLGSMHQVQGEGPRVFVISLFDGVAALMCAPVRLPVKVVAFASSEIDKECGRLVRKRWPGVIELGNIENINQDMIGRLAKSVGHGVDLVLVGGGLPCQDLSSLLADKQGLDGSRSKLFFLMPKIFNHVKQSFACPVHHFVENVFSMSPDNRARFSQELGCQPVLLDSKHFSWCNRPRLFWCSWNISGLPEDQLLQHEGYVEWIPKLHRPPAQHWVDKGCEQYTVKVLPTLTRALPRKTPPKSPAGIARASPEAIERWQQDCFRFQVYHYESENLLKKPDGSLRVASITERERLMGFAEGYLSNAMNPKKTFSANYDTAASMIGNSFQVNAIVLLLDELLYHHDGQHARRQLGSTFEDPIPAPSAWCSQPKFLPSTRPTRHSQQLVQEFLRLADKGGSDVAMDKRKKAERQVQRQGKTLGCQVITSPLHKRYLTAVNRVLAFWAESRLLPNSWDEVDAATSCWLDHIYADGLPKGYGSDALAALQHFLPEVSGKLRNSWRLLRTWNRVEPPVRVLPIHPLVLTAMAGLCKALGWWRPAALLLVGFDCFLRPGEIYQLKVQDIIWASNRATLTLTQK